MNLTQKAKFRFVVMLLCTCLALPSWSDEPISAEERELLEPSRSDDPENPSIIFRVFESRVILFSNDETQSEPPLERYTYSPYLYNVGKKELRIPTKDEVGGFVRPSQIVGYVFVRTKTPDGVLVVPSVSELGLVALKPGQAAALAAVRPSKTITYRNGLRHGDGSRSSSRHETYFF